MWDCDHHEVRNIAEIQKATGFKQMDFIATLDQPGPMFGLDNNWLSIYPYQVEAKPGDEVTLQVRYRNWLFADSMVRATFRAPEG
jgi:hypothetical protein